MKKIENAQTLFSPNFKNKTTSVVQVNIDANLPNYLIKSSKNEAIRLVMGGIAFSTVVVLSKKLGRKLGFICRNCDIAILPIVLKLLLFDKIFY